MQWYEAEVRQLEQSLGHLSPDLRFAVFYGSSTIRLWTHLPEDLGSACALNLGFGGSTLEACVYFFERLVPKAQPGSLIVYAGDNDLGDGRSPEQVLTYFRQLAAKVKQELGEIPFGFISIKASPARFAIVDRIRAANELIRAEIATIPNAFYISEIDALLGPDGHPRRELFSEDGLHLSPAGYRVWTANLAPYHNTIFNFHSPDCNPHPLSSGQHESRVP